MTRTGRRAACQEVGQTDEMEKRDVRDRGVTNAKH